MAKSEKEKKIQELLSRNVEDVISKPHLEAALLKGKPLRVKLGIDPTASDLHLGHAVVLGKLKEFQTLGHAIVLIIGDFTAQIGDPSGKSITRPQLEEAEIKNNMKNYLAQAGKILNIKKTEVRYNSEWLSKLKGKDIMGLLGLISLQQILERDDFAKRLSAHESVRMHELLYPVMQAYDSVAIRADVECGGSDQTFNLLMGRALMEKLGMHPQDVLAVPLLEGTDGVKKMSKSLGNYIALNDPADEMFGKAMSIPDGIVGKYFLLATSLEAGEIKKILEGKNPKAVKEWLGFEIVKRYHGESAAEKAKKKFSMIFSRGEIPDDIPELKIKGDEIAALELVLEAGKKLKTMRSRSDAWRLIEQGGFEVAGTQIVNPREIIQLKGKEKVVRVGKHHFFRVRGA